MDKIPLTRPLTGEAEEEAAAGVIRSGWLTQGPRTAEFERAVAGYVGASQGVATSSCTAALMVALEAAGVGPGDEVVTTAYSFVATANAIVARGARPVWADIDLATYNLDPSLVEEKITSRTKALLPVDQLGLPCDLEPLLDLAQARGLVLIQDAACALGSLYQGRPVGGRTAPGGCACFSFHPRKVITTGEGGLLVTNDPDLAARARRLVSHGARVSEAERHAAHDFLPPGYPVCGYNFRLSDVLAAVGLAQLKRLPEILARRRELARAYDQALGDHPRIVTPHVPAWARPNYQSYQVRLEGAGREERDAVVRGLRSQGVMATPGVADIHRQEAYQRMFGPQSLPQSELAAETTLILPLFPQMSSSDLARCAEALRGLVK